MKNKALFCLFQLLFLSVSFSQTTLVIEKLPKGTKHTDTVFAAGSFNHWNPHDTAFRFRRAGNLLFVTIPGLTPFEFKCTLGSWSKEELIAGGKPIANRSWAGGKPNDTLVLQIARWRNGKTAAIKSTAAGNVQKPKTVYSVLMQTSYTLSILIPADYHTSNKPYPVLYMLDGQNLFDAATAPGSVEWGIDESLNRWQKEGGYGCIVVGIHNNGARRTYEYSPFVNPDFGAAGGKRFAAFIARELKPYVDSTYRTLPQRQFNTLGGSSLGANLALYTAVTYDSSFSVALLFSPAFWFSDSLSDYIAHKPMKFSLKFALVCGKKEGGKEKYGKEMQAMAGLLRSKGATVLSDSVIADGEHTEWFWKREFPGLFALSSGTWSRIPKDDFYNVIQPFKKKAVGIRTHEIIPADTVIWQPVLNNRHKVWSAPNNDTPGYNYTIAYYNIYGMKTNGYLYFIYPKKVKYARIRD